MGPLEQTNQGHHTLKTAMETRLWYLMTDTLLDATAYRRIKPLDASLALQRPPPDAGPMLEDEILGTFTVPNQPDMECNAHPYAESDLLDNPVEDFEALHGKSVDGISDDPFEDLELLEEQPLDGMLEEAFSLCDVQPDSLRDQYQPDFGGWGNKQGFHSSDSALDAIGDMLDDSVLSTDEMLDELDGAKEMLESSSTMSNEEMPW